MAERKDRTQTNIWIAILLSGIGVSSIGDFIYLVALNLFVYNATHSAAAVAGIWVAARMAGFVVGPWAGSITDRVSHRKQLVAMELSRAVLVGLLPLLSQLYWTYLDLFLLGACSTFFNNASLPYQTLLVPAERRQRFNSLTGMLRYGSFLVGPAIAGFLLQHGETSIALWLDAASFLVSGVTLFVLPDFPPEPNQVKGQTAWHSLRTDWRDALRFLRDNRLYTALFSFNTSIMMLGMTADSQEVSFAQGVLQLGQFGYGMMVVAAGVGYVLGALLLAVMARRIPVEWMIGMGGLLAATGYLVYAFSYSFWWAVGGLVMLGMFGSASNVGFTTYTQHAVPVTHMGRVNNVVGPPQQVLSIAFILLGGWVATEFGVRNLMTGSTIPMCALALWMGVVAFMPKNRVQIRNTDVSVVRT